MAGEKEQPEQARQARLEAEARDRDAEARRRRLQLGAIGLLAVVIVGVVIVISQTGHDSGGGSANAGGTADLFASIPQRGNVLGEPDAPYTLTEFADLQCPFCKQYDEDVLPTVIDEYVREGELKLEFQPLTFIGPDSEEAARMALALGEQDHLWEFVDLFYRNQQGENSDYVDDDFLRGLAEQIPGADVDAALEARASEAVSRGLASAASAAEELGVESTPSFALAAGSSPAELLPVESLDVGEFTTRLDEVISADSG